MSDANGPYTLNEDDAGRYVISDMPSHLATFESHLDASVAVLIANLAHSQALTSQAARVRELEEALRKIMEVGPVDSDAVNNQGSYRTGLHCGLEDRNIVDRYEACDHGFECGVDRALEWAYGEINAALTPKEAQ